MECEFWDRIEAIAAVVALILSICSFYITTRDNNRQQHFQTLLELYHLGNTFTSNMYGFDSEVKLLLGNIESGISANQFNEIYHGEDCNDLRLAISYFDYLEKMIEDGSLSEQDCFKVVSFPQNLYKNVTALIEYERKNRLYDFEYFDRFCQRYILDLVKRHSEGEQDDVVH